MKQAIIWLSFPLILNRGVPEETDNRFNVLVADISRVDENQRSATIEIAGAELVVQYNNIITHDNINDFVWIVNQVPGYLNISTQPPVVEEPVAE